LSRSNPFRYKLFLEKLEERNLLTFYGGYRTVTELYADLATTAANYPDITHLVDYGQSYAASVGGVTTPGGDFLPGYDLMAMEVTNKAVPGPKPVFFLVFPQHGHPRPRNQRARGGHALPRLFDSELRLQSGRHLAGRLS
jgi:hypothetical protein